MYIALVELDVFSGVSIFLPGTSLSAPVYPLPPPTTVVGALSYPYMRQFSKENEGSYSASVKLLDYIMYAVAGARGYVITRDTERIYQIIYQRKQRWRSEEFKGLWYTVAPRGIVKYEDDILYLLYISNKRDILNYCYGITRVGRKESPVVVRKVVIRSINEVVEPSLNNFETIFYTPSSIAECDGISMPLPALARENYGSRVKPLMEEFYIPRDLGSMTCRVKSEGVLVKIENFHIAIPRNIISYVAR